MQTQFSDNAQIYFLNAMIHKHKQTAPFKSNKIVMDFQRKHELILPVNKYTLLWTSASAK